MSLGLYLQVELCQMAKVSKTHALTYLGALLLWRCEESRQLPAVVLDKRGAGALMQMKECRTLHVLLAKPRTLRIVKRPHGYRGLDQFSVDSNLYRRSFTSFRYLHPCETNSRHFGRRATRARDATSGSAVHYDRRALGGHAGSLQDKTNQAFAGLFFARVGKQNLTHETIFLEFDCPAHISLIRVGESIGVDTDNDVTLFEAKQALGLHAKRTNAKFAAFFHQDLP